MTPGYADQSVAPPQQIPVWQLLPKSTFIRLTWVWAVVIVFAMSGDQWLSARIPADTAIICFGILFAAILYVSTVGLTVPAVLIIGLLAGKTVTLRLGAADTVLVVLTPGLTALSFIGPRSSQIQGLIHLTLFAIYVVLLFVS